jgi:hypothetical protein
MGGMRPSHGDFGCPKLLMEQRHEDVINAYENGRNDATLEYKAARQQAWEEAVNAGLRLAAKQVRQLCKAVECENKCVHEHAIRKLEIGHDA